MLRARWMSARTGCDMRTPHTAWSGARRFIWCRLPWATPPMRLPAGICTRVRASRAPSSSWRDEGEFGQKRAKLPLKSAQDPTFVALSGCVRRFPRRVLLETLNGDFCRDIKRGRCARCERAPSDAFAKSILDQASNQTLTQCGRWMPRQGHASEIFVRTRSERQKSGLGPILAAT